jgi:hypothetical protein
MPDLSATQAVISAVLGMFGGYTTSVLAENRKRKHETRVLAFAFRQEIDELALRFKYSRAALLNERTPPQEPWHGAHCAGQLPIYTGNLPKIGMFRVVTAESLILFYRAATHAMDVERWIANPADNVGAELVLTAVERADGLLRLAIEAADLCNGLLQVEGVPLTLVGKEVVRLFGESWTRVMADRQRRTGGDPLS